MNTILNIAGGRYAEAISLALLHFLWLGTLLGLSAAATLRHFRAARPQVRYGVACVFLFLLLLTPFLTAWALVTGGTSESAATKAAGASAAVLPPPSVTPAGPDQPWFQPVLIVWLMGVFAFGVRAAGGWWTAWRRMADRTLAAASIQSAVQQLSVRMGVHRAVRVFESRGVSVPLVYGVLRPIVLFPACLLSGLDTRQLEAILAHELAHIVRRDFLVNCLQTMVEVLLFYHPAVWWLSRRIREEREQCCDRMAVDLLGDRVLYSRALLALEESRGSFAVAASGGNLKTRVERLLHPQSAEPAPYRLSGALVSLLIAAAIGGGWFAVHALAQESGGAANPYRKWANEDAAYIMTSTERKEWESLSNDSARAEFIRQFWLSRDPDPSTPANETKEEHYRRIAYANQRFAGARPGWMQDRGRIYIQNGPPDEIESHPQEQVEKWLYRHNHQILEFRGGQYELTGQAGATPQASAMPVLERILLSRIPGYLRQRVEAWLTGFEGRPLSPELQEEMKKVAAELDPKLNLRWRLNPVNRNAVVEIYYGSAANPPL